MQIWFVYAAFLKPITTRNPMERDATDVEQVGIPVNLLMRKQQGNRI